MAPPIDRRVGCRDDGFVAASVRRHRRRTAALVAVAVVLAASAAGLGGLGVILALSALVAALVVAGLVASVVAVRRTVAAGRQRVQCGPEALVGHIGVVRRPLDPVGQILVDGELWRARRSWAEEDEPPPREGDPVVIDRVQGLTLSVRRAEIWEVEQ
jgi:membrane-bound serine protease (ClpP class)